MLEKDEFNLFQSNLLNMIVNRSAVNNDSLQNTTSLQTFANILDEYFNDNSRLSPAYEKTVILLYTLIIALGLVGNLAVVRAFLTNKVMLTTRNIFIANLAMSDLLLCIFTMPLTMVDLITNFWTLGQNMELVCKLMGSFQATCVFFSSFSIFLIAVDRYRFLIQPKNTQISLQMAILLSLMSLFISAIMSLPLFLQTKLQVVHVNLITNQTHSYCYESWEPGYAQFPYTFTCFLVQYLIPSVIIGFIYTKVCYVLTSQPTISLSSQSQVRKIARKRKTNQMLVGVSLVFFLSWAPLNIYNLVLDMGKPFKPNSTSDDQLMLLIFAACHLFAMTSVCLNPILYGFLNNNFKQSLQCPCFQSEKSKTTKQKKCENILCEESFPLSEKENVAHL